MLHLWGIISKQNSSFGNWFTLGHEALVLIVLTDPILADSTVMQMLRQLGSDIDKRFEGLGNNPETEYNRSEMEDVVRSLCESFGTENDKIYQAK
jgi:hypothetical protein